MTAETHEGACHCGAVRFRAYLPDGLADASLCNCSMCRMRGAVALTAPRDRFEVLEGADRLTLYQFHTKTAEHYFCSVCGIYTHHRRRSNPDEMGVNAACLAGMSPFDFSAVPVNDGEHHTKDGGADGLVGTLHFIPAEETAP